jgi:hypothetical protein
LLKLRRPEEVKVEVEASRGVFARRGSKLLYSSKAIGSSLPPLGYMLYMPQPQPEP